MIELFLDESFEQTEPDARLSWYHPPKIWHIQNSMLVIKSDAKTDYWQRTHYGFRADNGHFLYAEVSEDMILTTKVRFEPAHQYDQAGLMVRVSPECWIKTSVEYEPDEPNKLGVVVTNHGYSDWSTQNISDECRELMLRIRREGNDYLVEYSLTEDENPEKNTPCWTQIRLTHLHGDDGERPIQCGLYACSPIDAGYSAAFDFLKIEKGRIGSNTE